MDRLLIVDGNNICYRARYGGPSVTEEGIIEAAAALVRPTHVCVIFDDMSPKEVKKKNFRQRIYPEYKAGRKKEDDMDEYIKEAFRRLWKWVKTTSVAGAEADDVIGTLARRFVEEHGGKVFILSQDRDFYQLICDNIFAVNYTKENKNFRLVDEDVVVQELGISPKQVVDFKALAGDSGDNIKGVRNIGKVNAVRLLRDFEGCKDIYSDLSNVSSDRVRDLLRAGEASCKLSYVLAKIKTDLPFPADFSYMRV